MDKIHIRNLLIRCIIGVFERERNHRQDVILNIVLHTDIATAARTDNLDDTVNYVALRDRICRFVEASSFHLIESLAEETATLCLEDPRVKAVDITVDKPGALTFAESVAVEISRSS